MASTHSNPAPGVELGSGARGLTGPVLLACALVATLAVYVATLRFGFVYDDQGQIVANTLVHSWRYVPDYFVGRTWHVGFQNASANYYRPVNFVWLRANYAIFGARPVGWHAAAILLHLLATLLAFFVARRLTGRSLVAALTALFFGVHPMTHEVVAWVSGTTESLWAVFAFGSFLCYLKFRDRWSTHWLFASLLLYAAGVFSKETAITLPVLILAHARIYRDRSERPEVSMPRGRGAAGIAIGYLFVAVIYLVARVHVLHGFSHPQTRISLGTFLLTLPSICFFYFRQWLLPLHPREFYDLPLVTGFSVAHVLLPCAGLTLIAAALWFLRRKLGEREIAFASIWMLIPLLPAMDFVVLPFGDFVHDRYFYFSSFGAALVLALALEKLAHGPLTFGLPRPLVLTTLALVLVLSFVTASAASYWHDNFSMFQHSYELSPNNISPRINYAVELTDRGELGNAIPIFEKVLQQRPDNYLASYGLGRALYEAGLLKPAEHFFQLSEQLNPDMPNVYLHLGLIDMKIGRVDQSVAEMRRAVALEPLEPGYHFALGIALQQQGSCKESRAELATTLNLQPDFPRAAEQMTKCKENGDGKTPAASAGVSPATQGILTASPGH